MFIVNISLDGRSKFRLDSKYNDGFIKRIKELDKKDRKWDSGNKSWILTVYGLYKLMKVYRGSDKIFFNFADNDLRDKFLKLLSKEKNKRKRVKEGLQNALDRQEKAKELKKELENSIQNYSFSEYLVDGIIPFPHQGIAAKFIEFNGSGLLAMGIGTGKTLASLLGVELLRDKVKKVLVLVPNSLKLNWAAEIEKFINKPYYVINFKKNKYSVEEAKYIIVNYDFFSRGSFSKRDLENHMIDKVDYIIADECHLLKNQNTRKYRNFSKSYKNKGVKFVLLTGTPMPSRIEELYVQLNLLVPEEFTSKTKFYKDYCGIEYDPDLGWSMINTPKFEDMNKKLEGIMYRVKREDVVKDLPPLLINKVLIEMTSKQKKLYHEIEEGMKNVDWDSKNIIKESEESSNNPLVILQRLRQYTAYVKISQIEELIIRLNSENEKVLIFDEYVKTLKELADKFKHNSRFYGGGVSTEERQELVNMIQDSNSGLMNLFMTTKTGNVGLTLTKSANIGIITQSYVPAENEQCFGRSHRIGQDRQVNGYQFIVEGSVDEKIYELVNSKQRNIDLTIDGKKTTTYSETTVLSDLLDFYREKYK
ncbi:MAG: DEAD/DEAH box helicase [bacterium]